MIDKLTREFVAYVTIVLGLCIDPVKNTAEYRTTASLFGVNFKEDY